VSEELASFDEFHDEINAEVVLEDVFHVYDERVLNRVQDIFFKFDVFKLLIIDNNIFADAFHGEDFIILLILNEIDFSKGAFSNHFQDLEVAQFRLMRHHLILHHSGIPFTTTRFLLRP
jgi:hypothetical protein